MTSDPVRVTRNTLPGDIRIFVLARISYVNARDRERLATKGLRARTVDAVYSNEKQEKAIEISRVEWLRRWGGAGSRSLPLSPFLSSGPLVVLMI